VLTAILRKTHWLADAQLQLCVRQVTQGAWFGDTDFAAELVRRTPRSIAQVGRWIGASGVNDQQQDAKLERILSACGNDVAARIAVLRTIAERPRETGAELLKRIVRDPDERVARMAVR